MQGIVMARWISGKSHLVFNRPLETIEMYRASFTA